MFIDFEIANKYSTSIKNSGLIYTTVEFEQINGGNTNGCREANELCSKIASILLRYQEDSVRDAKNIQMLANDFRMLDEAEANVLRNI